MWPSWLLLFMYPPPASAFAAAMSVVTAIVVAILVIGEIRGDNLTYSKFWRRGAGGAVALPSRTGMLLTYVPAFLAAAASFFAPGAAEAGARAALLGAALAAHFLKRVLEVLLVHRYSGRMPLATALTISSYYATVTAMMIHAQRLARGLPAPAVDLLYPGVLLFLVGVAGNFYHHYLLSRLRAGGGGGGDGSAYKVPTGGLFGLVTCPHYLFEILVFVGFAMISPTPYALIVMVGTAAYLAGRSYVTRRWYASKFEDFPERVKALVPYVF